MSHRIPIFAEHNQNQLSVSAAKCVAWAIGVADGEVAVAVCADDAIAVAAQAAQLKGVTRVLALERPAVAHPLAAVSAPQIAALAGPCSHVFGPATTFGRDMMPCIAAMLGSAQIGDIMSVETPARFRRSIYAGNALITVEVQSGA